MALTQVPSGMLASGAARANWGAGGILQVVQATLGSSISTASTTFVTTGLTASITPSSSTSKIFVQVSGTGDTQAAGAQLGVTIYRNSTNVLGSQNAFTNIYGQSSRIIVPANAMYLDSPATTSAVSYTVYFNSPIATNTVIFNQLITGGTSTSTITLMEISA
jgi:hypothetical protein